MYKLVRCTLGVLSLNQFLQSTLDGNKAICHISYVGLPVLFCLLLCPCAHHAQKLDKFEILSPEKPVTNAIPPAPPTLMESMCALLVHVLLSAIIFTVSELPVVQHQGTL